MTYYTFIYISIYILKDRIVVGTFNYKKKTKNKLKQNLSKKVYCSMFDFVYSSYLHTHRFTLIYWI